MSTDLQSYSLYQPSVCSAEHWHRPLIGNPMTDVEYRVVDEKSKRSSLTRDSGELLIAGPCLPGVISINPNYP
ncbi:MAG: hypothetical protein R3C24_15705 [Cyanobacteriota/Melainabacteria group bacterium]